MTKVTLELKKIVTEAGLGDPGCKILETMKILSTAVLAAECDCQ